MSRYVLDTNIVSLVVLADQATSSQMQKVVKRGDRILACPVVWYEVRRGLITRDAKVQMPRFERLFKEFEWQDYHQGDWALAADLWVKRRRLGRPIGDADLLIAVFAMNRNAVLVTNNEKDYAEQGLSLENWTKGTS